MEYMNHSLAHSEVQLSVSFSKEIILTNQKNINLYTDFFDTPHLNFPLLSGQIQMCSQYMVNKTKQNMSNTVQSLWQIASLNYCSQMKWSQLRAPVQCAHQQEFKPLFQAQLWKGEMLAQFKANNIFPSRCQPSFGAYDIIKGKNSCIVRCCTLYEICHLVFFFFLNSVSQKYIGD